MNPKLKRTSFQVNGNMDAGSGASISNGSKCEPLLDSTEAAQLLRIHPKTLQRMARKREIPAMQIGKLWRFSPSALRLWQQEKLAG